ncbi:hypothetical protein [Mesorhizobium sp.]|uniref:hypothetical protein n=1 Tax=Mesorhizobium sp. TaxID=1871066 RepID=UPI003412BA68
MSSSHASRLTRSLSKRKTPFDPPCFSKSVCRADWEMRAFGLAQACGGDSNWSIDWFRDCRELIVPADYMRSCPLEWCS